MRECNASFKTAVRFVNWRTGGPSRPIARTLSHYWYRGVHDGESTEPYDYACFRSAVFAEVLARTDRSGAAPLLYGWRRYVRWPG